MGDACERATVMVVDDTPENLDLLQEMLRLQGYRVLTFTRAKVALAAASRNPPDLLLVDIMMPEMDGLELCRRLKADDALCEIPVLFISALNESSTKVKAFRSGCVDYLIKPFETDEVRARVRTHLQLRKTQLALQRYNQRLGELIAEKAREIHDSQVATIRALASLAESRDDETGQHIERTRAYCRILAERLRAGSARAKAIPEAFVDTVYQAAPLHDIGKVGISDTILLKPGRLSPEEFEIVKTHVLIGAQTLQTARNHYLGNAFLNMGIAIARSHHERWDGGGYPDGLAGEDIPLSARIMAVADTYDALRSERPYKGRLSHEQTRTIMVKEAGTHFDPVIIEAFDTVGADLAEIHEELTEAAP